MAIFRRRREGEALDADTLALLTRHHVLVLPEPSGAPERVGQLVRSRVDDAELERTGRAQIGRRSAISGPRSLAPADATLLGVSPALPLAYVLEAPVERDPDGFDIFGDPAENARWMQAFPGGPPYREEGTVVGLGLDLARRLGGALRVAGTGVVMTPDPSRNIELTVWSPYWLAPHDLLDLLTPVLPGARQDRPGQHDPPPADHQLPWSIDPMDPFAAELAGALTPELLSRLGDVADATDAWAESELELTDGYAVVGDGGVSVGVQIETGVPMWILRQLADLPDVPTDRLVTYDIRWWPRDVTQLHIEEPDLAHRIARQISGGVIRDIARVTSQAVYGVVADAAGFHVAPADL